MTLPETTANVPLVAGDTHGDLRKLIAVSLERRPVAVLHVGDVVDGKSPAPLDQTLASILPETRFLWIPGNHDADSDAAFDATFGSVDVYNIHASIAVLPGGVRVAGLGGVFREQVWMPPRPPEFHSPAEFIRRCGKGNLWRGGLPRRHRTTIFPSHYEALKRLRADVLISHEAPSCHRHGFEVVDELARSLGVMTAFHGHHHDNQDYRDAWESLGFRAFGVGLCGLTTINGTVVIPGKLDDARRLPPTMI